MLFRLAWRNLWRNKRRTLLTLGAMSVSAALLVLTLGLYEGMFWSMIDGETRLYHGHVKAAAKGYFADRALDTLVPDDGFRSRALADPEVAGVAGRVRGYALVSYGEGDTAQTFPVELLGIDPSEESTVTRLQDAVTAGRFLEDDDSASLVLGRGLARRLGVGVGAELAAMGQGVEGGVAADLFRVVGIADMGDSVRDNSLALVGRDRLRTFLGIPSGVHEWAVRLKHPMAAAQWKAGAGAVAGDLELESWNDFIPILGEYVKLFKAVDWIYTIIFYFAVALVTLNTLYMTFYERRREYAVMGAVGLKPRKLMRLVLYEGLLLGLLAACAGGATGVLLSFGMQKYPLDLSFAVTGITFGGTSLKPTLASYPTFDSIWVPVVSMAVMGLLAALPPARLLRKQRPVDSLRDL